ncbi:MAG TPA: hypothetical protein PLZ84_00295 [Clostridia bacterium]|nr:hypothetical protein [Clostridia bacterium]
MESFTNGIPDGWSTTTPQAVSPVTAFGRVHSGNSAVNLRNGAVLTQEITGIDPGCFYEFSFFARANGCKVGVIAVISFITANGTVPAGMIIVRQKDLPKKKRNFGFYKVFTVQAPENATGARIEFNVSAMCRQSLDLDNVSFGSV